MFFASTSLPGNGATAMCPSPASLDLCEQRDDRTAPNGDLDNRRNSSCPAAASCTALSECNRVAKAIRPILIWPCWLGTGLWTGTPSAESRGSICSLSLLMDCEAGEPKSSARVSPATCVMGTSESASPCVPGTGESGASSAPPPPSSARFRFPVLDAFAPVPRANGVAPGRPMVRVSTVVTGSLDSNLTTGVTDGEKPLGVGAFTAFAALWGIQVRPPTWSGVMEGRFPAGEAKDTRCPPADTRTGVLRV